MFNPVAKVLVIISGDEGIVFIEVVNEVLRAEYGQIVCWWSEQEFMNSSLARLQSEISQLRCDIQDINMIQGVDRSMIMTQLGLLNGNAKSIGYPTVQMLVAAASQRAENLHLLVGVIACDSGCV
jgi:hypothetical protein